MLIPYAKPHLSVADQVNLLENRGMIIADRARAERYLRRLGYYRLSGYWYPARQTTMTIVNNKAVFVAEDTFRPGTTFERAVELYVFDKRLRLLFLDAIERIEVSLRVEAALLLTARDPLAHRNPNELHGNFAIRVDPILNCTRHADWLRRFDESASRSKEEFVKRFRSKYSTHLPMWIAIELWDFGQLSHFISGMKNADVAALAALYQLPRHELLSSWVRTINHVRNVSAHHSRLWNRVLTEIPKQLRPGEVPMLDHLTAAGSSRERIYVAAAIIQHLMGIISPRSTWAARFKALVATFPTGPGISLQHAGFSKDWEQLPLWS